MKRSVLIIVLLSITFVIDGAIAPFVMPKDELHVALLHGLLIGILCYAWCRADAHERSQLSPGRSALWAGVFPLIGVPVYLFRTRAAGPAIASCLKTVAVVVALFGMDAGVAEAIRALRT
jgi:hypothetical protein